MPIRGIIVIIIAAVSLGLFEGENIINFFKNLNDKGDNEK
jgi:hypothetical protein